MKRGAFNHPKTKRLAAELEIPRYAAFGLLEALLHFTAEYAPGGDVGRFTDEDLAQALEWDAAPARLVEALVATGWLERSDGDRLVVVHWSAHADDAVNRKLARSKAYFADGTAPSLRRLGGSERAEADRFYRAGAGTNAPRAHVGRTAGALPEPRLSPAPPRQGEREGDPANAGAPTATPAVAPAGATPTPARSRARRKPEPPAWALLGADALLEHVLRLPGGRVPRGARERWAAELARMPAEVAELARGDPGPALLEAITWLRSAANAGEFEIVVHSGAALREKWPKIAAARRRAASRGARSNGRSPTSPPAARAVAETAAPPSAEELRMRAAVDRLRSRYGIPSGKAPPGDLFDLAMRGATDEELDAAAWKHGLCLAPGARHLAVSDGSPSAHAPDSAAIAAPGATCAAPAGSSPRAAHERPR